VNSSPPEQLKIEREEQLIDMLLKELSANVNQNTDTKLPLILELLSLFYLCSMFN